MRNITAVTLAVILLLPTLTTTWRFKLPKIHQKSEIPTVKLYPKSNIKVRKLIVNLHNRLRSSVRPSASDMLRMTWDVEAAKMAQRYAEQCRGLNHNTQTGRWTQRFGSCGENIFIATHKVPWQFAIRSWFSEKSLFSYGCSGNNLTEVGHYTQMVWSSSHKVGCGFAKCVGSKHTNWKKYYAYVCNYCPPGNFLDRIERPYTRGAPCSRCKDHCGKVRSKRRTRRHSGGLCTNSCPVSDLWVNCSDLRRDMGSWMCENKYYHHHCKASCTCQQSLHH